MAVNDRKLCLSISFQTLSTHTSSLWSLLQSLYRHIKVGSQLEMIRTQALRLTVLHVHMTPGSARLSLTLRRYLCPDVVADWKEEMKDWGPR